MRNLQELEQAMDKLRLQIKIEKTELDEEITRQPQLYYQASDLLAEINGARDAMKEDIEVLGSEIQMELRDEYDRDKSKYTEKSILAEVISDKEYKEAMADYRLYKALSARALALQSAFETKTRMLAHLARLYIANYYSDPTTSGSTDQVDEVRAKHGREASTEKRRRSSSRRVSYSQPMTRR